MAVATAGTRTITPDEQATAHSLLARARAAMRERWCVHDCRQLVGARPAIGRSELPEGE